MSVGTNTTRVRGGAVAANGYLYHLGGVDGTGTTVATVQYAKLNADGTVGTWAATTSLPGARRQFQPVVANGYIYVIGGRDNSNATQAISYYAKLNADGSVGTWNTTTALTAARFGQATIAYNGYIYVMGGFNSSIAVQNTVYSAKINANGTLASAWSTATNLPTAIANINGTTVANGYVYIAGGATPGYEDDMYYAKLNTDGTTGSWTTLSNVLNGFGGGDENYQLFVANGYLYVVGGDLSNRVVAFALNANGSLGGGTALTNFPLNPMGEAAGASANGYFYVLGGSSGSDGSGTVRNTVYYTSGSRVKVGGNLDLVGYSGENLAEGNSGGQLTAGNTSVVGTLQVQDSATFARSVTIGDTLRVTNSVAVGGNIDIPTTSATAGVITQNGARWIHSAGDDDSSFYAGTNSGNLTNTGFDNIGIGWQALQGITTGFFNVGVGTSALAATTDGIYNAATGYLALQANNGGYYNAGFGARALHDNTEGANNTAVGGDALYGNLTGDNNAALGYQALTFNETGANNVAIGTGAGFTADSDNANVSGSNNTFVGYNAGPGTTTQLSNASAIGANAVVSQNNALSLGCVNGVNGCSAYTNIGIGTATPVKTLQLDRGAAENHIQITNDGTGHTATDGLVVGLDASGGSYLFNFDAKTMYIGTNGISQITIPATGNVGISNTSPSYRLHVGSSSLTSGTQVARFQAGASTCDVVPGGTGFTCSSDRRLKKNIQGYSGALDAINQIDVKTYNMIDQRDSDQRQIGVIAQELEKVLPSLVQTDKQGYKSVSYAGLSPVLLQAIKEQQKEIDQLKKSSGGAAATTASTANKRGVDFKELILTAVAVIVISVLLSRVLPYRTHKSITE